MSANYGEEARFPFSVFRSPLSVWGAVFWRKNAASQAPQHASDCHDSRVQFAPQTLRQDLIVSCQLKLRLEFH